MEYSFDDSEFGSPLYKFVKRLIDILGATAFILVFSPVYILTMLIIYLQDKHAPLYFQLRVGRGCKEFKTYKFRSMVYNAEEILKNNKELYAQLRSGNNKAINDPRITKFGKFIRKYSIDEFPQMFNVLFGQMSIVGPRPLRPDEFDIAKNKSEIIDSQLRIISTVKPGITGYWQTHGRSNVKFEDRMRMEAEYASRKSIPLDIKIILITPYTMLKGEGAY